MKPYHVHEVFILMGLIIVISFLGTTFIRRIKIPNSIILILIGIILNVWNNPFDLDILRSLAPAFGSFALMLILLEAGLEFDIRHFFKSIGPAVLFGALSYFFGVWALFYAFQYFFHLSSLISILLALVSVGCSPSILMPILKGMMMDKENKSFLDLECNVTEVLGLIFTLSMMPFLLNTLNGEPIILKSLVLASSHKLLLIFASALTIPVALGMIWSRLLSYSGEKPLWPILTIGITLLLYGASESVGGKGALNVLIFGLVIGNARIIRAFFVRAFTKLKFNGRVGHLFLSFFVGQNFAKVQHISREFSFFVRTFFFVYLGTLVDFSKFNFQILFIVIFLTLLPMIVRFLIAVFVLQLKLFELPPVTEIVFLTPRGLANVLIVFAIIQYASLNLALGKSINILQETLIPSVFGVIMMSNMILTFYLVFRKARVD